MESTHNLNIIAPRALRNRPFIFASVFGLVVSLAFPLGTTVIGLILFGVIHNVLELRYVASRFIVGHWTTKRTLALIIPIGTVVFFRLFRVGGLMTSIHAAHLEILAVYGTILGAWIFFARLRKCVWIVSVGIVALAGWVFFYPELHFLSLSHLHNLIPVAFLLLHPHFNRRKTLMTIGVWAFLIPAMILVGVLDDILMWENVFRAPFLSAGESEILRTGWTGPEMSDRWAGRVVCTFSYLQWMHYWIWVIYLPFLGGYAKPDNSFFSKLCFGRLGLILGVVAAIVFIPFFLMDYIRAFSSYASLASFHALFEFPLLLVVLLQPKPK
jgi:hypothetical protein